MNGLRAAWAVIKNDLFLILAKPSSTLLAIMVPINFLILFSLFALGGARVPVALYTGDTGHDAEAMSQALDSTHTFRKLVAESPEQGEQTIAEHKSVAAMEIPPGFSRAVSKGASFTLPIRINNLNADFADDIRRALPLAVLNFYRRILPNALPLNWREIDQYPHDVSFLNYLAVSIQTVSLLLGGILLTGRGVAGEWERGTIKELKLSPVPAWGIITGKMTVGFITSLAAAMLVFAALMVLGVRPEHWGLFLGVLVPALFVFVAIGMAVGILVRSQFVIYPLVLGLALPLFFISGAFGPVSWSTPAMLWVARLFPVIYVNTLFQRAFHGFWTLDSGAAAVWLMLVLWAAASLIISVYLYRRAATAH